MLGILAILEVDWLKRVVLCLCVFEDVFSVKIQH